MNRRRFALLLATWGGCGYFPFAPGTLGSAAALAPAWIAAAYFGLPAWSGAAAAVLLFLPACWAASEAERASGAHDPSMIVVDEVVGQWLALAVVRPERPGDWLAAFLLFRLFDIFKPWPVRALERLPAGYGVVADDAAAGLYAMITLTAVRGFLPF